MQIFTFNCANQRLRRFTSGVIYADSYPNTMFKFNFNTPDWDMVSTKTAVFSYRGENYQEPLDENNMCKVPAEVLHEGHFLISVYGNSVPTNTVRIPVAEAPKDIIPGGGGSNCDCGPSMVYVPEIDKDKILSWTIQEANENMTIPNPVDLNPADDWVEDETVSEYEWEDDA